jgi:flagellar basal-body rod protein FlgC
MDLFGVFDISSAGMSVEQSRLAVAASNLANARTSSGADGTSFQPLRAVVQATSYASVEAELAAES